MTLPLADARKNEEIISLNDSQMLRWIDELNGVTDSETAVREIRSEIRTIRKRPSSAASKKALRKLYEDLDRVQFKADYMCLIIDRNSDYKKACKGFLINGIRYVRLLGTSGGVKNKTIVFVSERLAPELRRRIENGRDPNKALVPAKLEAYKALTCSGSIPVSFPRGILVVNDCETSFKADIVSLSDEAGGEPVMKFEPDADVTIDASDGYGLMLPSLAQRWSQELGLDYQASAVNTRFSWEKGVAICFDFQEFARDVAGSYTVTDAWGDAQDIRDVELVLTTSMVKLYDSYASCDDYVRCSLENGYAFGVTKTSPEELESERTTNYQFLQSYLLTEEEIDELIRPTVDEIKDVLDGDWRKAVLYLQGGGLNEQAVWELPDNFAKAMMIDPSVFCDKFVKKRIYSLISKRIDDAKIGVLKVHGNYSIVSGDPYALCQSMFGLPVTGLLKSGEIYNQYWLEQGADTLACFRAPMTCMNNIRKVHVARGEQVEHWYQYISTCTIFNAWDTSMAALNGMDFDGDICLLTDNRVLVDKHVELPALMCAQRKAPKCIPDEDALISANIASFGDDIGKTTNWVTTMFNVRSRFPADSEEYKILDYRIKCGQLLQQNAIDKTKGIVASPMPKEWYDREAAMKISDPKKRQLYLRILADKKPYFMRYIYPAVARDYSTYVKRCNTKARWSFLMSIDELIQKDEQELTEAEREFLGYYWRNMPLATSSCVMNRICRRIETEFRSYVGTYNTYGRFDYSVYKSGVAYDRAHYREIEQIYKDYVAEAQRMLIAKACGESASEDKNNRLTLMARKMATICTNDQELCDIMVDIGYRREGTKQLVWDLCGPMMIENLLRNKGWGLTYPERCDDGEIEFAGARFTMKYTDIGDA